MESGLLENDPWSGLEWAVERVGGQTDFSRKQGDERTFQNKEQLSKGKEAFHILHVGFKSREETLHVGKGLIFEGEGSGQTWSFFRVI